jgi:hypothetical protein
MSSFVRSYARRHKFPTKFVGIETPSYSDSTLGNEIPFPFIITDGYKLDLDDRNSFVADMIDTSNVAPDEENKFGYEIMDIPIPIRDIGDRLKDYIRSWKEGTIDEDSPIELYQPFSVMKIRPTNILIDQDVMESSSPPGNRMYSSDIQPVYVFHSPMTLVISVSGSPRYLTFFTKFQED